MSHKIFLIRHAESELNKSNHQIRQFPDTPLSENEIRQCELPKYMLSSLKPNNIYCSSYLRSIQTKELSMPEFKSTIVTDDLREYDPGTWFGKDRNSITTSEKLTLVEEGKHFQFPGGESFSQVQRRASSFLENVVILPNYTYTIDQLYIYYRSCNDLSHGITIKAFNTLYYEL